MMMCNLSLLIVMALLAMAASTPTPRPTAPPTENPTTMPLLGGWISIDPADMRAQNATKYAVSIAYPKTPTKYKVFTARYRAYLGYIYDLNVAVTFTKKKTCSVHNYVVLQNSGGMPQPYSYSLISKTALTSQKCKSTRDMI